MVRFQKEEEEKTLKALKLFCFPEGVNWAPLTEYRRYCDRKTHHVSQHALWAHCISLSPFLSLFFLCFTVKHSLSCLQMLMEPERTDTVGGCW